MTGTRPAALPLGLGAVALLLACGVGYLAWDLSAMNDVARARAVGRDAAAAHVERVLSYDHASFDEDTEQAQQLMTERFHEEYRDTMALVRREALSRNSVVRAEVVVSSVVTATADRVQALLLVNQTTEADDLRRPGLERSRVVATLVPGDDEDEWLLDDLDVL